MDLGVLLTLLVDKTVSYFLDLFLNGMFEFLSGILFGGVV